LKYISRAYEKEKINKTRDDDQSSQYLRGTMRTKDASTEIRKIPKCFIRPSIQPNKKPSKTKNFI